MIGCHISCNVYKDKLDPNPQKLTTENLSSQNWAPSSEASASSAEKLVEMQIFRSPLKTSDLLTIKLWV